MESRPREHQLPVTDTGGAAPVAPPARAHPRRAVPHAGGGGEPRARCRRWPPIPPGYPYGSVASYGLDDAGNPLFFVSLMAEHTQNAIRDPRASLLVTEPVPDGADPLASGRVTLLGLLATGGRRRPAPASRDRYLEANPTSAYYIDFGDFTFYRLDVREHPLRRRLRPDELGRRGRRTREAEPDPLVDAAAGIIEHMNADHADAQVLFCRHLAGRADTTAATMSAVDRYGFEMIAVSRAGRAAVRLGFPEECTTGDEVRRAMVAMVAEARAAAGRRLHSDGHPVVDRVALHAPRCGRRSRRRA